MEQKLDSPIFCFQIVGAPSINNVNLHDDMPEMAGPRYRTIGTQTQVRIIIMRHLCTKCLLLNEQNVSKEMIAGCFSEQFITN